jgi:TPP-dependent indolepyruvate ferredoxin oxidoreductase alpha subunit
MVHNPPSTGHLLVVLDAESARARARGTSSPISVEALARSCGVPRVDVVEPAADPAAFERLVGERLEGGELAVVVARGRCTLTSGGCR